MDGIFIAKTPEKQIGGNSISISYILGRNELNVISFWGRGNPAGTGAIQFEPLL
jgi:hypothetical protein